MFGRFLIFFSILPLLLLSACARTTRKGIISQNLPLTIEDIAEIRNGEKNHEMILMEYAIYENPKLQIYLNAVAANIAEVSSRPHLPYRVVLLDTEEVNIFGGPGGFIYMSRGLLNFVNSESELAAAIAHEVSHISNYDYSDIPQHDNVKRVYSRLVQGTELASEAFGAYGSAAEYGLKGLKGIGRATPVLVQRFGTDAEIATDKRVIEYLAQAGYDPQAVAAFLERLANVEMNDVGRFVKLMNAHPPFQDRRNALGGMTKAMEASAAKIELRKDLLNEVRQITVNAPDSIVFQPSSGVHRFTPEMETLPVQDQKKLAPEKTGEWFH